MKFAPLLIVAGVLIGLGVFVVRKVEAAEIEAMLDPLFQKWGDWYGVDPLLLKAHAMAESDLDPQAINPRDPSYGVMQVLCTHGEDGACTNRFNVEGWGEATVERLLDPDFNIMIAAQIVAWNIRTYGLPRAVAVYNRWDQRTAPQSGPFANQDYVNRVLGYYADLRADRMDA